MVVSMTGFAQKIVMIETQDGAHAQLSITLKSLNSRFFECTCKLPYALTHLETDFIKNCKKKLRRGNVTLVIQASNPSVFKSPLKPDVSLAKSYITSFKVIQTATGLPGSLHIQDIIELPNLFYTEEQPIDKHSAKIIKQTVHDVIEQLMETRIEEGKGLLDDLNKRVKKMEAEIDQLQKISKDVMDQKKKDIGQKLELGENLVAEVTDAQRAVYYLELDKIDIHEEIIRFKNHLENFKACLHSKDEEKGRRLDFILQELGRETNTIAAKCADARISSLAINLKVEVEKSREQVQNIV